MPLINGVNVEFTHELQEAMYNSLIRSETHFAESTISRVLRRFDPAIVNEGSVSTSGLEISGFSVNEEESLALSHIIKNCEIGTLSLNLTEFDNTAAWANVMESVAESNFINTFYVERVKIGGENIGESEINNVINVIANNQALTEFTINEQLNDVSFINLTNAVRLSGIVSFGIECEITDARFTRLINVVKDNKMVSFGINSSEITNDQALQFINEINSANASDSLRTMVAREDNHVKSIAYTKDPAKFVYIDNEIEENDFAYSGEGFMQLVEQEAEHNHDDAHQEDVLAQGIEEVLGDQDNVSELNL